MPSPINVFKYYCEHLNKKMKITFIVSLVIALPLLIARINLATSEVSYTTFFIQTILHICILILALFIADFVRFYATKAHH